MAAGFTARLLERFSGLVAGALLAGSVTHVNGRLAARCSLGVRFCHCVLYLCVASEKRSLCLRPFQTHTHKRQAVYEMHLTNMFEYFRGQGIASMFLVCVWLLQTFG